MINGKTPIQTDINLELVGYAAQLNGHLNKSKTSNQINLATVENPVHI